VTAADSAPRSSGSSSASSRPVEAAPTAQAPSWSHTAEHSLTGTVALDPASDDDDADLDVPDFLK